MRDIWSGRGHFLLKVMGHLVPTRRMEEVTASELTGQAHNRHRSLRVLVMQLEFQFDAEFFIPSSVGLSHPTQPPRADALILYRSAFGVPGQRLFPPIKAETSRRKVQNFVPTSPEIRP